MPATRYSLLRVFVSITAIGLALGLLRFVWTEVSAYGGGVFPALCVIVSVGLIVLGIGLLFPRAALRIAGALLEIFGV